ncbi:hypothetical protein G6W57_00660 [Streptomyces sp. CAI-121]|uniref:hypothetical protein n=1 Tax=unclassified Streptomyces TaxID=2593676 RepID=UPI0015877040|nr:MULTISPECIES: hypothetical protein [unclassified Streptomyces]NUV65627.1 hypothetical protein [Streptomyces sp. CAI-121]NUW12364.1 hypothetical protein [Streptomyces sp. CAI-68]
MRTRTAAAAAALLFACSLTACGSDEPAAPESTVKASAPEHEVDCSDTSLDQSDWMEHCNTEPPAESEAPSTGLPFGKAYAWPDGLEVTVLDAKVFSDWDEYEEPDPKSTEFRIRLKVDNKSETPVDLSELSIMVDGATNGGTAAGGSFTKGSAPLEGRIASGVSAVKTDDNTLEKRYGKDIVVTVQRVSDAGFEVFPEFTGTIK